MNLEEMREMLRKEAEKPKAQPPKPPASTPRAARPASTPPRHFNARSEPPPLPDAHPAARGPAVVGDMTITPSGEMKVCTESGTPGVWEAATAERNGSGGGRLLGLEDLSTFLKVVKTHNIDGSTEISATLEAFILFGLPKHELEDELVAALKAVGFNHFEHIEIEDTADGAKVFTQIQRSRDPF